MFEAVVVVVVAEKKGSVGGSVVMTVESVVETMFSSSDLTVVSLFPLSSIGTLVGSISTISSGRFTPAVTTGVSLEELN